MALETGGDIIERFNWLKSGRGVFENTWTEIANEELGLRNFNLTHAIGEQRHKRIYDTTALSAGMLLASTMHGLITNPGAPFHQTVVPRGIRDIGENNDYLVYLDETMDMLYKDERFGFPTAATEFYIDYIFFGTAGMFTADVPGVGPVDFARPLGELVVDESKDDKVDTVFRIYEVSPRQFIQEFGPGVHPPTDREAEKSGGGSINVKMLHLVHPRSDIDPRSKLSKGRPFRSVHIVHDDKTIVRESGSHSDPWQVARWGKEAGERYGRGPGWQALPDSQTANEMRRIMLESGQSSINPALLVPDDGILTQVDTSPRALVVYRAGAFDKDGIRNMPQGDASPITIEVVQAVQAQIQQRFFAHLLNLFDEGVPTATQALEMESKAARILVSTVSRAAAEFASKSLRRKFDVASRAGMFEPPPETLNQVPIQIRYLSPIMKSQRQMQTRATLNTYAAAGQMAQFHPDIIDNFDGDAAIREIAEAEGMNLGNLNSVTTVAQQRQARAQIEQAQQQQAQQAQQAENIGKALPALTAAAEAQAPRPAQQ